MRNKSGALFRPKEGEMKHWNDVIAQSGDAMTQNIYRLDENKLQHMPNAVDSTPPRHLLQEQKFYLVEPYGGIYFTRREAECLYYLLHGMTIVSTAEQLALSPRTVEFYVKNMKEKMRVRSKSDLMECLHEVGFLKVLQSTLCDEAKRVEA
jgi:DNA-binding CsgD family transcriptional regulator